MKRGRDPWLNPSFTQLIPSPSQTLRVGPPNNYYQPIPCGNCRSTPLNFPGPTIFQPIRLDHLAVVATFKTFGSLTPEKVRTQYYRHLRRIIKHKKSKVSQFLVQFGHNHFSTIIGLISNIESSNQSARDDPLLLTSFKKLYVFDNIEPSCCCVAVNGCINERTFCVNFRKRSEHLFRFAQMNNSHRSTHTACCCSGYHNPYCPNYGYVRNSLNFSANALHTIFLHCYSVELHIKNSHIIKRIEELLAEASYLLENAK